MPKPNKSATDRSLVLWVSIGCCELGEIFSAEWGEVTNWGIMLIQLPNKSIMKDFAAVNKI
jgi:hypothetical protein